MRTQPTLNSKLISFAQVLIVSALVTTAAHAQKRTDYVPQPGQDGKDVIWLPTEETTVDKMLSLAKVTPSDMVIDLGSGDGRTVIAAAKLGAKALGIEFNPEMVGYAKVQAEKAGVGDKVEFRQGDVFETDFSNATVLTMFLLTSINIKLQPKILAMKAGTRVVTNTFTMGDWQPDESATVTQGCTQYCTAHLWYVPAKINGRWTSDDGVIEIQQMFQNFTGTVGAGGSQQSIDGGKLKGAEVTFKVGSVTYSGLVDGDAIKGTKQVAGGSASPWQATRAN